MQTKILKPTDENIQKVAEALRKGEVIGLPTETVYGLAGDCRSRPALSQIFAVKERPTFDPLIVHLGPVARTVATLESLQLIDTTQISASLALKLDGLLDQFWPGPLTVILPKHPSIPDLVTSGLPTVGLRMPRHPVAQALLEEVQTPLAAPSANRFGRISPTSAMAVQQELGDRIPWILDGGEAQIGVESTVITFSPQGQAQLLRPGGTPREKLEEFLGEVIPSFQSLGQSLLGPGMLESHYAPEKPFFLLPKKISELTPLDFRNLQHLVADAHPIGLLRMGPELEPELETEQFARELDVRIIVRTLSETGDLSEAAHRLFAEMRFLDLSEAQAIFCEPCNASYGLGFAIADRLKRASAKRISAIHQKL